MKYPIVLVKRSVSIQKAIQLIEQSPFDSAFVTDEAGSYLGSLVISDLRRLLISGGNCYVASVAMGADAAQLVGGDISQILPLKTHLPCRDSARWRQ